MAARGVLATSARTTRPRPGTSPHPTRSPVPERDQLAAHCHGRNLAFPAPTPAGARALSVRAQPNSNAPPCDAVAPGHGRCDGPTPVPAASAAPQLARAQLARTLASAAAESSASGGGRRPASTTSRRRPRPRAPKPAAALPGAPPCHIGVGPRHRAHRSIPRDAVRLLASSNAGGRL